MPSTTARIKEQDYEEIREVAERNGVSVPEVMTEILDRVDLDKIDAGSGQYVGACPECGAGIPVENVDTQVLSGSVLATCPDAERDDDVHQEAKRGRYRMDELDLYDE